MIKWLFHIASKLLMDRVPSPVDYERMQVSSVQSEIRARTAEQGIELLARENEDLRNAHRGLQRRYDALIEHLASRSMPMRMTVPEIGTALSIRQAADAEDAEMVRMANAVMEREGHGRYRARRATPRNFTGTEPEDL